jgi:hypothetical protein
VLGLPREKTKVKVKPLFWPVAGTLALGFFIGACSQRAADNSTPLGQPAHAQDIRNAEDLQKLSTTYADIAKKVTPAVVNITSETVVPGRVFRDPFDFWGDSGGVMREPDQHRSSLGSGVIVDPRGIIITKTTSSRMRTPSPSPSATSGALRPGCSALTPLPMSRRSRSMKPIYPSSNGAIAKK